MPTSHHIFSTLLALAGLVIALAGIGDWCLLSPDGCQYLTMARSLAETGHFPPETATVAPGLAVLIAPLVAVAGPVPFLGIRVLLSVCWITAGLATYLLHRRELGDGLAWAAGLLVAASPVLFTFTTAPLSELPFIALLVPLLGMVNDWWRGPTPRWSHILLAGLLTGAAVMIRSMGVVLVPIMAAALFLPRLGSIRRFRAPGLGQGVAENSGAHQRPPLVNGQTEAHRDTRHVQSGDRRANVCVPPRSVEALATDSRPTLGRRLGATVIYLACALAPQVAWQIHQGPGRPGAGYGHIWTSALAVERTNATGLSLQAQRLWRFAPLRLAAIKEAAVPKELAWRLFQPPLDGPAAFLIGGFFVVVALIRCVRYRSPVDAYVVLTILMLCFWPWDEGVRLVAPLIPIFVSYPLWLGRLCWRRFAGLRAARIALAAGLVLLLAVQVAGVVLVQHRLPAQREKAVARMTAMQSLGNWLTANTPADVACLGIAPDRHNGKTLLLGAAYLARHPIRTIDWRPEEPLDVDAQSKSCILLHESIPIELLPPHPLSRLDRVGEFVILRPRDGGPG